ncbi:hypothetical protein SHIRM173S_00675 [Streptomyces hirsutus]
MRVSMCAVGQMYGAAVGSMDTRKQARARIGLLGPMPFTPRTARNRQV